MQHGRSAEPAAEVRGGLVRALRLSDERDAGKWIVRKSNIERHKARIVKLKISPERTKMTGKQVSC